MITEPEEIPLLRRVPVARVPVKLSNGMDPCQMSALPAVLAGLFSFY